ncbi:MAG: helix-turn-helix transcriptional regulator [Candidatus Hodarchaeales archaeon]
MNQKTIANELDISETTMSRIISRLESKNLVVREPYGMSKMIKLNKDRLC